MPYKWTTSPDAEPQELRLWPHQSLPPLGFAAFVLATFTLILFPLFTLLGSVLLWGMLPFALFAVGGIYYALQANHRARQIEELLVLDDRTARLIHRTARGETKEWVCNRYWTKVTKYEDAGPVPHYVTLQGEGREVEIGAFLSEEERLDLYDDLLRTLKR